MPVTFGTVDRRVTTTADGFAELLSLLWKTVSQMRNAASPASSASPMSHTDQSSLGSATGPPRPVLARGRARPPPPLDDGAAAETPDGLGDAAPAGAGEARALDVGDPLVLALRGQRPEVVTRGRVRCKRVLEICRQGSSHCPSRKRRSPPAGYGRCYSLVISSIAARACSCTDCRRASTSGTSSTGVSPASNSARSSPAARASASFAFSSSAGSDARGADAGCRFNT